jgi:hypothetical protein
MPEERRIRKVLRSKPTIEGAGVHLRRALGFHEPHMCDPFLLLDDFRSDRPEHFLAGFPWHPHRGIETITYVLRGTVEHGDSLGNNDVIEAGDVQWMTTGSGIIHQEMPKGDVSGTIHGFQLWANLPAAHKMMDPRYRAILAAQIPEVRDGNGVSIRVIAGSAEGVRGPVQDVMVAPEYLDVTVPMSASFVHEVPRGHTALAYVIGGKGVFCQQRDPFSYDAEGENYFDLERNPVIGDGHLVVFGDGDQVTIGAEEQSVRLLLISGKPLGEPIAWHGPIVMNTQEELRTAFEDLRRGTFIKVQSVAGRDDR